MILQPQPLPSLDAHVAARLHTTRRWYRAWVEARVDAAVAFDALSDDDCAALTAPKPARQPVPHPGGPRSVRRRRAAGLVLP